MNGFGFRGEFQICLDNSEELIQRGCRLLGLSVFTSGPVLLASGGACYPGTNLLSEAALLQQGSRGNQVHQMAFTPNILCSYCSQSSRKWVLGRIWNKNIRPPSRFFVSPFMLRDTLTHTVCLNGAENKQDLYLAL